MSDATPEPLEQVLRLCAAAAPEPWYPRLYVQKHKIDPMALDPLLEELWLDGLIEKAGASPETGPGIALTARGREVLEDPELLERLRTGQPLEQGDRGAAIRAALRTGRPPVITRLLVLANLAVFAWGLYLASGKQLADDYIKGFGLFGGPVKIAPATLNVWHDCGAARREDLSQRQWWRLLTANWVHFGLPHLLMNMLGLYWLGRLTEASWGRWRYLVLYLVSGWVSVCVGLMYLPADNVNLAGASGGICGLMGAEVVWVLANGRYLPRTLRRQLSSGMVINLVFLFLMIYVPGVSRGGHLAGAVAGVATAVLLQLQRFGAPALRAPAAAAVILVPLSACVLLGRNIPDQRAAEQFERLYVDRTNRLTSEAHRFFRQDKVQDVLVQHWTRRSKEAVTALLPELERRQKVLAALAADLEAAGPQRDPDTEKARLVARDYVASLTEVYGETARCLRAEGESKQRDEKALSERTRAAEKLQKAWQAR
jgi:rhomboid protease GluP